MGRNLLFITGDTIKVLIKVEIKLLSQVFLHRLDEFNGCKKTQ